MPEFFYTEKVFWSKEFTKWRESTDHHSNDAWYSIALCEFFIHFLLLYLYCTLICVSQSHSMLSYFSRRKKWKEKKNTVLIPRLPCPLFQQWQSWLWSINCTHSCCMVELGCCWFIVAALCTILRTHELSPHSGEVISLNEKIWAGKCKCYPSAATRMPKYQRMLVACCVWITETHLCKVWGLIMYLVWELSNWRVAQ